MRLAKEHIDGDLFSYRWDQQLALSRDAVGLSYDRAPGGEGVAASPSSCAWQPGRGGHFYRHILELESPARGVGERVGRGGARR